MEEHRRPPHKPFDYAHYELSFRDRDWNRALLAAHVPCFVGCRKVLDLACGSGIFLELLAERGIPAVGVERNQRVAAWGQAHGWEVVHQDVFAFLDQSQDSYDGIFCSHFLEHLPFDQVLRLVELVLPRLESGGTLVFVVPNPESMRMQLFGFWRDPEHVRFYHPELIEAVCKHYGLSIVYTNRHEDPFALAPLAWTDTSGEPATGPEKRKSRVLDTLRGLYVRLLHRLRLVPKADLVTLEERLHGEITALRQQLAPWAEKTTWALNRMWAWPDTAVIVCRKPKG